MGVLGRSLLKIYGFFYLPESRNSMRHAINNEIHISDLELDNESITISFVENLNR